MAAPKKTSTAKKPASTTSKDAKASKAKKTAPQHPAYKDMIKDAILQLKERNGSSRQALKKYILKNYNITSNNFESLFNMALKRGVEKEEFVMPKGPSGTVKLQKASKDAAKKVAAKKESGATTKKSTTSTSTTKKSAATTTKKKAATTTTKKAAAPSKVTKKAATTGSKAKSTTAPKGTTKSGRKTAAA